MIFTAPVPSGRIFHRSVGRAGGRRGLVGGPDDPLAGRRPGRVRVVAAELAVGQIALLLRLQVPDDDVGEAGGVAVDARRRRSGRRARATCTPGRRSAAARSPGRFRRRGGARSRPGSSSPTDQPRAVAGEAAHGPVLGRERRLGAGLGIDQHVRLVAVVAAVLDEDLVAVGRPVRPQVLLVARQGADPVRLLPSPFIVNRSSMSSKTSCAAVRRPVRAQAVLGELLAPLPSIPTVQTPPNQLLKTTVPSVSWPPITNAPDSRTAVFQPSLVVTFTRTSGPRSRRSP